MTFIPPLLFACSVNIDAFLVGMSYGLRKKRITFIQNLFISLIAFIGTLLSILSGSILLFFLPPIPANLFGCGILICFGSFYFLKHLLSIWKILPLPKEPTLRLPLSLKATVLLGISLSCNNIGIGIGASLGGISFLSTAVITFFTSIFFLSAGNRLGESSFFRISETGAELLSGITLILLGLCNLFF